MQADDTRTENGNWTWSEEDAAIATELNEQLPECIFDFHAHLYSTDHVRPASDVILRGPQKVGYQTWKQMQCKLFPHKTMAGAVFTPFPSRDGSLPAANAFVLKEVAERADSYANVLVAPDSDRSDLRACLQNSAVVGLKPYHTYSNRADTFQSAIHEYVPEWIWELAHQRQIMLLLHLVQDGALAAPGNLQELRSFCQKYPGVKVVLAHAGRGFHGPNTVKAAAKLADLNNIWFDNSAICEAEPLQAVLESFGPRRLLWGSDFPVCCERGRCVTLGTGFGWVTRGQIAWNERAFFGEALTVGLESLRALLAATRQLGLNKSDLEDIFRGNAERLLGLRQPGHSDQQLYEHAKQRIPGGTQLLSKRPEMFAPGQWPPYFHETRGCEIWDSDGRHFYDMATHGIGACLLGYNDPDVKQAVLRRVQLGSFCSLNSPDEVALADRLCEIHPWAECVRFARAGGEAMSVAVRIARATSGRSAVAVCGYHGWHDWYLAANLADEDALEGLLLPGLAPRGVPHELKNTTFPFHYNNREEFDHILDTQADRLAAIVMEPCRYHDPEPGFLEHVQKRARQAGALLVFDEITVGWRTIFGGAHLRFNIAPDIAVFAKSLGNGYPMAAVIGTREAMDGAHSSFISSTYWTEGIGPAAALAVLKKMATTDIPEHCAEIGRSIQSGWRQLANAHDLPLEIDDGYPVFPHFVFQHEQSQELRTLFSRRMLEHGFLAGPAVYLTLTHTSQIVDHYLEAVNAVFAEIAQALQRNSVVADLQGEVAHRGFQRLL